jgi:predicted transcriptional regulator
MPALPRSVLCRKIYATTYRSPSADRDVKAVHSDITALLAAGILDRTADGEIAFPFDAIKVEFLLQAA